MIEAAPSSGRLSDQGDLRRVPAIGFVADRWSGEGDWRDPDVANSIRLGQVRAGKRSSVGRSLFGFIGTPGVRPVR